MHSCKLRSQHTKKISALPPDPGILCNNSKHTAAHIEPQVYTPLEINTLSTHDLTLSLALVLLLPTTSGTLWHG